MNECHDLVHIVILDISGVYCRIYDDMRCTFDKFRELQRQYYENKDYKIVFLDE